MRSNRLWLVVSAVCLALLAAPAVQAKKAPNSIIKVTNLAKAKAKDVKKLEKAVKKVKGVTLVVVAKKKGEVKVWHKATVNKAALEAAIAGAGYAIEGGSDEGGGEGEGEAEPEDEPTGDDGGDDDGY